MTEEAKPAKPKRRPGTKVTDAVKATIVREVSLGRSLRKILRAPGLPSKKTVLHALAVDAAFARDYAAARVRGIELHIDEIIDLADSATAENYNAVRLKVDTRKWLASKLVPKVYGDRVEFEDATPPRADKVDLLDTARAISYILRRGDEVLAEAMKPEAPREPAALPYRPAPPPSPVDVRPERPAPISDFAVETIHNAVPVHMWWRMAGVDEARVPAHLRPAVLFDVRGRGEPVPVIEEDPREWRRRVQAEGFDLERATA